MMEERYYLLFIFILLLAVIIQGIVIAKDEDIKPKRSKNIMALSEQAIKVKEKLKSLEGKKRLLKTIQRQIANARADISGVGAVSYDNAKVDGGNKTSVQERFTALITRLENRYQQVMEEAFEIEDAIAQAVYCLNEVEQSMIIDRYVNGWSWRKIERAHNYCERQSVRIHNEALEKLAQDNYTQRILLKNKKGV